MVDVPINKDGSVDYKAIMHVMSDPQWEKRIPMLKALYNLGAENNLMYMGKEYRHYFVHDAIDEIIKLKEQVK